MERITIFNRTTKKDGTISIRFRLTDGRAVQLYHKSKIQIDLKDLDKLTPEGVKKPRALIDPSLLDAISKEIEGMHLAYKRMCEEGLAINGETFERCCDEALNPQKREKGHTTFLQDFEDFIARNYRDGVIGDGRLKHYQVTQRELNRFLTVKALLSLTTAAVDSETLMQYRDFLINEYKYVEKWHGLYVGLKDSNVPTKPRSQNTVAQKLNQLQAFFSQMADEGKISQSPFNGLGRTKKSRVMAEKYDEPVFLSFEDFERLRTADISESLEEARDAFILQCSLGCRISDFQALKRDDIVVNEDGIGYVRYTPKKTAKFREEINTPLLDFAIEILKKYDFSFRVLRAPNGGDGYNHKLKRLFKEVGLSREFSVFNESTKKMEYIPLHELISNKVARKTYVTILSKTQVNLYASGLHKTGSDAVNHYVNLDIRDRFILACAAFNRKIFSVDKDLNITYLNAE